MEAKFSSMSMTLLEKVVNSAVPATVAQRSEVVFTVVCV